LLSLEVSLSNIKLIALDMDDTLLNTEKHLSKRNMEALKKASELGIQIVPATGRLYDAIPDEVRNLDFINYAITVNGSSIYDVKKKEYLCNIAFKVEEAVEIMSYIDNLPLIYDCYIDGHGYMNAFMYEKAKEWVPEPFLSLVIKFRTPVPEIKKYIAELGKPIQKIQLFVKDVEELKKIYKDLQTRFPNADVTSSIENNIEVCTKEANKGITLLKLADMLGIAHEDTMAFGDGGNDVLMMKLAGFGVAMDNGIEEVKKNAKYITASCNEDGVAQAIEKFVLTNRD